MTALVSPPAQRSLPVARPRTRGRMRLTRRGRWVLGALLVVLLAIGFTLGRATSSGAAAPHQTATVRVEPGQTLWAIASKAAPNRDPRDEVADIQRLNHLSTDTLIAGQVLTLP